MAKPAYQFPGFEYDQKALEETMAKVKETVIQIYNRVVGQSEKIRKKFAKILDEPGLVYANSALNNLIMIITDMYNIVLSGKKYKIADFIVRTANLLKYYGELDVLLLEAIYHKPEKRHIYYCDRDEGEDLFMFTFNLRHEIEYLLNVLVGLS